MNADIHGLSGAYAVDALEEGERAAFEAHLAECVECQAEVASLREAATSLASLSETAPPPALRGSVLEAIRGVRPMPPEAPVVPLHPHRRALTWLAGAAAAVLLVVGGLVWSPWDGGPGHKELTAAEQVLRASDAQRYEKAIDGARATIVRSESLGKAVIIADNMPAAPPGKDYQLWLNFPGKGMVSAGVMPHEAKPTLTLLLEGDAAKATAAGITVEPAGGSTSPTTTPIALIPFT